MGWGVGDVSATEGRRAALRTMSGRSLGDCRLGPVGEGCMDEKGILKLSMLTKLMRAVMLLLGRRGEQ